VKVRSLVLTVCIALLTGCATNTAKYNWGNYDPSLYAYYKNPAKAGELSQALENSIKGADKAHKLVAPGMYAEYGYLLLQAGRQTDAISSFQQEESHWPESKPLMDRMIALASTAPRQSTTKEP